MKTFVRTLTLVAALLAAPAFAVNEPEPTKKPSQPPKIMQGQTQAVSQAQLQAQDQAQDQAQAQGQAQQAEAQALSYSESAASSGSSSSSGGNSQSLSMDNPRQAPAISQGSFAIQGCGVAGNLGGSNTSGAGFLGFGFTPEQCYDFMLAQAFQSLGAYEAACKVLNASRAGKRAAERGVTLPKCTPPAALPPAASSTVTAVDLSSYVTREEIRERDDRIVRTLRNK